jgi:hypothetical protein
LQHVAFYLLEQEKEIQCQRCTSPSDRFDAYSWGLGHFCIFTNFEYSLVTKMDSKAHVRILRILLQSCSTVYESLTHLCRWLDLMMTMLTTGENFLATRRLTKDKSLCWKLPSTPSLTRAWLSKTSRRKKISLSHILTSKKNYLIS